MYGEKYVRRGEIYRVRLDTGWGSEQGASRPALIISAVNSNSTVIVAYMTTRDHDIGIHYGPTKATGVASYVCCEQLATVSRTRLIGNIMGSLSPNEMREVESRLDEVLDLGYVDDAPLKEKEQQINALKLQMEELKSEVLSLKTSLDATRDDVLSRDVEIAVHKRMYQKAVDIIAAMRMEPAQREVEIEQVKDESQKETVEPPKKPVEPKLVDINSATFGQLRAIGLSNNIVLAVINSRPHESVEDLRNLPGMNAKLYGIMEKKMCCVPVQVEESEEPVVAEESDPGYEKVNVNTASAKEIHEAIGLSMSTCYSISGYRKKNGPFEKLDDLLNVTNIFPGTLERYRHMMEV